MHATPLQPWNWIVLYNAQVSFFIDFTLQQVLLFQRRIVSYLHNFTLFVLKKKNKPDWTLQAATVATAQFKSVIGIMQCCLRPNTLFLGLTF
jgi:hypothetical protein